MSILTESYSYASYEDRVRSQVSFVVGDRHLFSPDNINVFWLDPDTEQVKPIQ